MNWASLNDITFANPRAFFLLVVPVLFIIWHIWRNKKLNSEIKVSFFSAPKGLKYRWRIILKQIQPLWRILAYSLLVVALARPQTTTKEENVTTEGIDIVLATDVSTSMLARDFKPNRLESSKMVAEEFINNRPNDRIGLVVFAGESFTQCPITTDHAVLTKQVSEIRDGLIEDGTAIGMGLGTSVNRLKDSQAKSKVIILLTDGVNNTGFVDPLTAAEAAVQFGIRVYTIGVGTRGMAPYPFKMGNRIVYQDVEVEIDEKLLEEIAEMTGGIYYRATDNEQLIEIYEEIDQLEKTKIEVTAIKRVSEEFYRFALLAALFFAIEILLRYTITRSWP